MPGEKSSSDSDSDGWFGFGVGYDTSNARQLDEYIKKRKQARKGGNFERDRRNLFQSNNNVADKNNMANAFDKIVLRRKNSSRPARQPSPTVQPKPAKAVPGASSGFIVPEPRLPLVKKFINSGQAVARKLQLQLVRTSVPNAARVDIGGMTVSTPKTNHILKSSFNNSVQLSPIKRVNNVNQQDRMSQPRVLDKMQQSSKSPIAGVDPIKIESPPSSDHQLSLSDEDEPINGDEVVVSSSHSSIEIDRVDQSMSIHDVPLQGRSLRSSQYMNFVNSCPQQNNVGDLIVQASTSPRISTNKNMINSLVDEWSDEADAADCHETPVKQKQVSFHRFVTVIPGAESSSSDGEPEVAEKSRSRIQRRRSLHEAEDMACVKSRMLDREPEVVEKSPSRIQSRRFLDEDECAKDLASAKLITSSREPEKVVKSPSRSQNRRFLDEDECAENLATAKSSSSGREPKKGEKSRSRIKSLRLLDEDECDLVGPVSKKPVSNSSSHFDTVEYETPDTDATYSETLKRSKEKRDLAAIEEEIEQVLQHNSSNQNTNQQPANSPVQPLQCLGSSNDSIYYDSQKSPTPPEPASPSSAKYGVSNRSAHSKLIDSPMSDGSLLWANDCENVRQSILSQETECDKDEDVFVVPSNSIVVKKRGRPKKTAKDVPVVLLPPNAVKKRAGSKTNAKDVPFVFLPSNDVAKKQKSKDESNRNSTLKRRLFSQENENSALEDGNNSQMGETSRPLDLQPSHRKSLADVKNTPHRLSQETIGIKKPLESSKTDSVKTPSEIQNKKTAKASSTTKAPKTKRVKKAGKTTDVPRPSASVETTEATETKCAKKAKETTDEPLPSTSDEPLKAPKTKRAKVRDTTDEPQPSSSAEPLKSIKKKRTKKVIEINYEPSTWQMRSLDKEAPHEADNENFRRSRRSRTPRAGFVSVEEYVQAWEKHMRKNKQKILEKQMAKQGETPKNSPVKLMRVEQPRLAIIPEAASEDVEVILSNSPTHRSARDDEPNRQDDTEQSKLAAIMPRLKNFVSRFLKDGTAEPVPQLLPLASAGFYTLHGITNMQFIPKNGYDFFQLSEDGSGVTGYMRIPPMGLKPFQRARTSDTKILIIFGQVNVMLGDRIEHTMEIGQLMTIEMGHKYCIRNALDTPALIFFMKLVPKQSGARIITDFD